MSFEKQLIYIDKKRKELSKTAELLEREEIIERCVCKRNIRRRNRRAAFKSARKCVELSLKSKVYNVTSKRIKVVLDYINYIIAKQVDEIRALKPLVCNLESSLNIMNFDLLDLYLDSIEDIVRKQDSKYSLEGKSSKPDSLINQGSIEQLDVSSSTSQFFQTNEMEGSKLPAGSLNKDGKRKDYQSSLLMFKPVSDDEVDRLIFQLSEEVKVEDKAFLYKKP